jgi:hypothetical protein
VSVYRPLTGIARGQCTDDQKWDTENRKRNRASDCEQQSSDQSKHPELAGQWSRGDERNNNAHASGEDSGPTRAPDRGKARGNERQERDS